MDTNDSQNTDSRSLTGETSHCLSIEEKKTSIRSSVDEPADPDNADKAVPDMAADGSRDALPPNETTGQPQICRPLSLRRKSNRDTNSIRLKGVGKTAHTFYRRMRTLFFSDSSEKEYQALFSNGNRRKKKTRSNESDGDGVGNTGVQVQRVTSLEEAPIYVIDNFLTEKELEYFDQKISVIPFERSFVDNMGYNNGDEEDKDGVAEKEDQHEKNSGGDHANAGGTKESLACSKNDNDSTALVIEETRPTVDGPKQSGSNWSGDTDGQEKVDEEDAKKTQKGKKRKKRKRKTLIDDSHRTSTFYSFRKLHDSKISALERRIANILGCWVHQIEALQLVRYVPGQFFGVHHDLGNLLDDDTVELPRKDWASKRRLVTIFCYLNTLHEEEGGCTYFPKCNHLRVKPRRGRAVLWCNITQDGKPDPKTIHAGEAVKTNRTKTTNTASGTNGKTGKNKNNDFKHDSKDQSTQAKSASKTTTTKYGLNIWVCEE